MSQKIASESLPVLRHYLDPMESYPMVDKDNFAIAMVSPEI